MTDPLFKVEPTHNPHHWCLAVTDDLCVGRPDRRFLFGGVGLAAAISALEQTCKRPVVWATAQYLSFTKPGTVVDLDVRIPIQGKYTSQASVIGHIENRNIITVSAALGARDSAVTEQWVPMPDTPPPSDCVEISCWGSATKGIQERFETRAAGGRFPNGEQAVSGRSPDGRLRFWIRSRDGLLADSMLLAIAADYVAVAITNAIGSASDGNSLDNTIRYIRIEPCEWILCDIRIEAASQGIVHGVMRLFSENGLLMASASQSLILRTHDLESA